MPCTFVYFDVAFTLLRPVESVGQHYADAAREFGLEVEAGKLDAQFLTAWRSARATSAISQELPYGRTMEEALRFWTAVMRETFLAAGYEPPANALYYKSVFEHFSEGRCWMMYKDVDPALKVLEEAGVGCGAMTNFDPRIHNILRETGLAERLSRVITSSEAGAEKPSPVIFHKAWEALSETERDRVGLIGDEAHSDGLGAVSAGWRQCLVVREGAMPANPALQAERDLVAAVRRLIFPAGLKQLHGAAGQRGTL